MSYANARIFTVRYIYGFMKNSIFLTSVNAMFSLVRFSVLVHNFAILNFAMCCHSNVHKFQLFFPKNFVIVSRQFWINERINVSESQWFFSLFFFKITTNLTNYVGSNVANIHLDSVTQRLRQKITSFYEHVRNTAKRSSKQIIKLKRNGLFPLVQNNFFLKYDLWSVLWLMCWDITSTLMNLGTQ